MSYYALGRFTGYSAKTLPGVREAIEVRWPREFGQGDKLFPLERETGRYGQGDTEALRG
jgi:hypothetical protein